MSTLWSIAQSAGWRTKAELAREAGLPETLVCAICSGRRLVSVRGYVGRKSQAARLATALGISSAEVERLSHAAVARRKKNKQGRRGGSKRPPSPRRPLSRPASTRRGNE